jgi:hypothetical protein
MADAFLYGMSVGKRERFRLHDTGVDGKEEKRSLKNDGSDID